MQTWNGRSPRTGQCVSGAELSFATWTWGVKLLTEGCTKPQCLLSLEGKCESHCVREKKKKTLCLSSLCLLMIWFMEVSKYKGSKHMTDQCPTAFFLLWKFESVSLIILYYVKFIWLFALMWTVLSCDSYLLFTKLRWVNWWKTKKQQVIW